MVDEAEKKAGCLMPLVWFLIAGMGTCAGLAGVGIAVNDSETAGVEATMIAAFPLGLLWSGLLAAAVVHFVVPRPSLARIFVPLGCSFVGACLALAATAFFFMAIFPAL